MLCFKILRNEKYIYFVDGVYVINAKTCNDSIDDENVEQREDNPELYADKFLAAELCLFDSPSVLNGEYVYDAQEVSLPANVAVELNPERNQELAGTITELDSNENRVSINMTDEEANPTSIDTHVVHIYSQTLFL